MVNIKLHHLRFNFLVSSPRILEWVSVCLQCRRPGFDPWVGKIPWRRKWQPTPVFLPGESHGRRSLVGYSPRDRKESDTTERLHFHFRFNFLVFKNYFQANTSPTLPGLKLFCRTLKSPRVLRMLPMWL